jgi:hypothetical protein
VLDRETSMRIGAERYRPVTDALTRAGWPAKFTQLGGMNLALEVTLEGGHQVLVTDVDDCLSWDPRDNRGWDVTFHPDPERPELGEGPFAFASAEGRSFETLIDLVRCVVRAGTRRLALDGLQRDGARPSQAPHGWDGRTVGPSVPRRSQGR